MQLQPVESSLINAIGYGIETSALNIRFNGKADIYEYGNVPPELYEEMATAESVGKFFLARIKPFPDRYPFRKLDAPAVATETTDFTSNGTPVPVVESAEAPADPEALKSAALALTEKAKAITINSAEAYQLAATTLLAIARMRGSLETTFRPDIKDKHAAWQAALAVLNYYDKPLAEDESRLRLGITEFNRREEQRRLQAEQEERERQQKIAEEAAQAQAQELQLADAIAAEERGEPKIAEVILNSAPLPIAPAAVMPVRVQSTVPKVRGLTHREDWTWDLVDLSQVPRKYLMLDERALNNEAKTLKGRAEVPGIRFYDRGSVSVSRNGTR
jgi:KTSC domain